MRNRIVGLILFLVVVFGLSAFVHPQAEIDGLFNSVSIVTIRPARACPGDDPPYCYP